MIELKKLADLLINYSLEVKKGDKVLIQGTAEIIPFVKEAVLMLLEKGAYVWWDIRQQELTEMVLNEGSLEQIAYNPPYEADKLTYFNKMINFISDYNSFYLKTNDNQRQDAYYRGKTKYIHQYLKLVECGAIDIVVVLFPLNTYAQELKMSYWNFQKLYSQSCGLAFQDVTKGYREIHQFNERLIHYLRDSKIIKIKGDEYELTFSVEGNKWINGDGKLNVPDGEVFSAPIKESVTGKIKMSYPVLYGGSEIKDIELTFEKGKVVAYKTSDNKAFEALLNIDEGARFLGEIGFGTNYHIETYLGNVIFDEKIGGTLHIALGSSYPKCGQGNDSSIHIDMIKETKGDVKVYVDDQIFLSNRKYMI